MIPPLPHSPLGAQASFTLGGSATEQGFVFGDVSSGPQEVFVGCRASITAPWSLLPFYSPAPGRPEPLSKGRFGRFLAAAGDKWMIGPLVLKLCSPFEISNAVQDERFWYAPVVCGYLEYDNSHNDETAEVVFGVSGEAPARGANSASGFDFDGTHGFATASTAEVRAARTGDVVSSDAGPVSALLFTVPAASKRIFPLVLGFFHPGFFYTELFSGLRDVLDFGLLNHAQYLACADALDAEFMRSQAPFDQKTSGAHALRSWLATSRRLAGQPALDVDPLRALWRSLVAPN